MFRPDRDAFPRWAGNLKQYKLGLGNGRLQTQDADSVGAVNSSTGFITECARSFWTPSTVDTYWAFTPPGACLAVAGSRNSNYPDGNIVEKGAQAYTLRAPTAGRAPFKTCSDASCTGAERFRDGQQLLRKRRWVPAMGAERRAGRWTGPRGL